MRGCRVGVLRGVHPAGPPRPGVGRRIGRLGRGARSVRRFAGPAGGVGLPGAAEMVSVVSRGTIVQLLHTWCSRSGRRAGSASGPSVGDHAGNGGRSRVAARRGRRRVADRRTGVDPLAGRTRPQRAGRFRSPVATVAEIGLVAGGIIHYGQSVRACRSAHRGGSDRPRPWLPTRARLETRPNNDADTPVQGVNDRGH
jgi:hypothetical protein